MMQRTSSALIFGILIGALITVIGVVIVQRSGGGVEGAAHQRKLKVGHSLPEAHPVHAGIVEFAERVEALSGGALTLSVFPSSQLGSETQMLEQVQRGTLDFTKASAAPMGNFVSVAKVFSLPYLFRDRAHFWTVLDGEIGQEFLERLSFKDDGTSSGFRGLTFYDGGSRNFYTKEPVRTPSDLAGVKVRVMKDPVAMDMVSALGGSPTPLSPAELYTALKQGVVDGAENNPPTFVTSRHHEITKHFIFDQHSRIPDLLVVSEALWSSLSDREKGWLAQAAAESSQFQRAAWQAASEEAVEEMRAAGVQIYEADVAAFAEAVKPVIEKHAQGEVAALFERIQAAKSAK